MNHRHFKQIIIDNHIATHTISEIKLALKLIRQKEKFILEDSAKALNNNRKIVKVSGKYSLNQYIQEVIKITNHYYLLYIQISQFEAFLRTYINHKMVKAYGIQWHKESIMDDLVDFQKPSIKNLDKPSQALNSISFGTLEFVFLNGSRYANVFQKDLKFSKILAKDAKPKYRNKDMIKELFAIVRNARNDICHHRRIGESIKANPKYTKQNMTRSDVSNALHDLKILLGYDDTFDVQSIELKYNEF
ncbi:MAG TPA: hypothetical protein CFH84_09005 [Sulfurimonas sp. UBA12504]|nr:MAG TPA: hypothetical protein CFH84_09005 [Sulfurimonas sp. UBA12504]